MTFRQPHNGVLLFTALSHPMYRSRGKGEPPMSDTGLQKLAFFLLVALVVYVAIVGGA